MAAATSTGGISGKHPGRVGDSPLVAAGTWADDATAGISCTGDGEAIIRVALAHEIDALMRHAGLPLAEACDRALAGLAALGTAGLIAVGAGGRGRDALHDRRDATRMAGGCGRDRHRHRARWLTSTTSTHSRWRSSSRPVTPPRARSARRATGRPPRVVAKLPKPTPAAWTANQVAREQPELIEALLEMGAALRDAQEAAISGGGGRGLRDATLNERAAIDAVMSAATAHRPAGRALSRAMADRLRTTLHAAASDEPLREALAAGRLMSEAQAGGAWPFALEPSPPTEKPPAKKRAAAKNGAKTRDDDEPGVAGATGAATKRSGKQSRDVAAGKGDDPRETAKRGGARTGGGAATRRAAAKRRDEAAEREAAERAAAEAREAAEMQARTALEQELREARGSLRIRERVFAGAREGAEEATAAAIEARAALEQAQRAAADANDEAEAAERMLAEARSARDEARDDVARLEERLD